MAACKLRLEEQKIARSEKLAQERVARKNFMKIKKEAEKEEKVRQLNEKLEQRKMEKQEAIASLVKVKVKLVKNEKTDKKGAKKRQQVKREDNHEIEPRKEKTVSKKPHIALIEVRKKNEDEKFSTILN